MALIQKSDSGILDQLHVKKVINCFGPVTILGGSILDRRITKAMEEISQIFVDMDDLLDNASEKVSRLLGVEAAFITSGAAAGLALSAAGCMTGLDQSKIEKLPDVFDFEKNEIIVQAGQRNTYDRCLRVAGARLISVGIPYLTYPWQLRSALNAKTAAIAHFTLETAWTGVLNMEEVHGIAEEFSVPIIVDGCNEVLPTIATIKKYFERGADLMVLSGGKSIQGPNDTGIICGKKELVQACRMNASPHMNGIGRTMKVSKEQIVGLVTALEIYAESDPYVRLNKWIDKLDFIRKELLDVPGIRIKRSPEQPELSTVPILEIQLDEQELGFNSRDIVKALKGWDPPIVLDIDFWIHFRKQAIFVNPSCLQDSEEVIVANALKRVLTDRTTLKELLSEIPRINAVAYP